MRYLDFDLWIDERVGDRYPLRAACLHQGEARDRTGLDPDRDPLRGLETRLADGETDAALLTAFGSLLYSGLFEAENHNIAVLFERARGARIAERGEGLRVRLRIGAPAMADLPWELLYSRREEEFLSTDAYTALVRYIEVPEPVRSLETTTPFRMMVVIPAVAGLDTALERRILEESVEPLEREGVVKLTWLDGEVSLDRVSDALLEHRFHLIHFVGHGGFSNDLPFLVFNDGEDGQELVDHHRFAGLLKNHPTMKLVVLNSCQGAEISSTQPLLGMAPELIRRGVPAVVAMQYPIPDKVAILFAREFFGSLFRGPERGRVEFAISHARNRLETEFPGHRAVATPVLFTRAPEGVLFGLLRGRRLSDMPFSPRRLDTFTAIEKTHQANLVLPQSEEAKATEIRELERVRSRIRFRNRSLVAVVAVAVVLFCLSWFELFDRLPPELKLQSYMMWLGDVMRRKPFSDQIALVATDQEIDRSWRPRHAAVLDRLVAAGARAVVFNLRFLKSASDEDADLPAALRRAAAGGTRVVVAVDQFDGPTPGLAPAIRSAVSGWGISCVGQRWRGASSIVPLVTRRAGGKPSPGVPALALAGVLALQDARLVDTGELGILNEATGELRPLGLSDSETIRGDRPDCKAIGDGDRVAMRFLDVTPIEALRRQTFRYEEIETAVSGETAEALRGKIVVVGERTSRGKLYVGFFRQPRYELEFHADAINTLLSGVTIRPVGSLGQLALLLALAAAGALIHSRNLGARSRRAALTGVVLVYLVTATGLYVAFQLLLTTAFHLGALVASYVAVGNVKRRIWP